MEKKRLSLSVMAGSLGEEAAWERRGVLSPFLDLHYLDIKIMFKYIFLEREVIIESKTGLHLSLRGLDVEIMAIKDW